MVCWMDVAISSVALDMGYLLQLKISGLFPYQDGKKANIRMCNSYREVCVCFTEIIKNQTL